MKEIELIPNARNLMESTRSIGYSLPAAVADLVDNSLAANSTTIEIWTPTDSEQYLLILDDGFGMDEQELHVAMRYGSKYVKDSRESNDLGRFGLGLKMASLSQARSLTVLSKKENNKIVGACWDLDYVANSNSAWPLQLLEPKDIENLPWVSNLAKMKSGTLVIWQNLDILLMGIKGRGLSEALLEKIGDLKAHLSLVFHRFIEDGEIRIIFNGDPLVPIDPFLKGRSQKPFAADTFMLANQRIVYEPYILPHPKNLTDEEKSRAGDLQKDQGFYIYRNKRLVIWGTWFRLSRKLNLSKLARVRVDIPATPEIDHLWSLDVKKSSATIPEELRKALRIVVEKLGLRSKQVWARRARVEQTNDALWLRAKTAEGNIHYEINEGNPLISTIIEKNPEIRVLLRLISSRLPLDSLYTDLNSDKVVEDKADIESLIQQLKNKGFDTSSLERNL